MHVQLIPQNTVALPPRADKTATYQRQDLVFEIDCCFLCLLCSLIYHTARPYLFCSEVIGKEITTVSATVAKTFVIVSQHVYQFEQSHQMFVAQSINAPIQH